MADSFFGFNTSLTGLELVDEPELDEEEEYDALNDETFGTEAFQGDWEEDHTKFAEVTENSRTYRNSFSSEKDDDLDLEASLSQLVLESEEEGEDEDAERSVKQKILKSANILNRFPLNSFGEYSSSPAWSPHSDEKSGFYSKQQQQIPQNVPHPVTQNSATNLMPPQSFRIPTVQELERDLMQKNRQQKLLNKSKEINHSFAQDRNTYPNASNNQNSNSNNQFQNINSQQQNLHDKFPHPGASNKFPPGFGPSQQNHFNQAQQQEMVMLRNNQNMPMQLGPLLLPSHMPMLLSPHVLPHNMHPLLLSQNPRMVKPHHLNVKPRHESDQWIRFIPKHPFLVQQQQQQQQQQLPHHQKTHLQMQNKVQNNQEIMKNGQASRNHYNSNLNQHPWLHNPNRRTGNYDEYAGLMNNRERQWLLNIQIIQLATDKPHVDDYYYMVWSKKKEEEKKLKEENRNGLKKNKQILEAFFPSNRQSKTDVNQRERRDSDREISVTPSPRVYVPLQFENSLGRLQCGSVTAPRKIIDLDVVPERQVQTQITSQRDSRKTKKILLELEMLYLLAMDIEDIDSNLIPEPSTEQSDEPPLSKPKLLEQIMSSYLNEERFVNFMCIRKGKTLLLRILSHLNNTDHSEHLTNLWCRLFKSVSVIIRRDQSDGILLQMYPYFKQWIDGVDCTVLSMIASYLLAANVPNQGKKSSRAVSPNPGKSVLSYILTTTFGVSSVSSILSRGETIYPELEQKEQQNWTNFIMNFIKHMTNLPNIESIPTPLDPLPANVVTVILNRSTGLHIQDYASAKRVLTAFNKDKSRS
ncbi:hypothetical protein RUM43_001215 [Polyplax serrata]|uniref:Uncharacterized protein n=1 Tax=Polyplax serrata TaxID=468196 RepID=A0AAN8SEH8_POLSC